MIWSITIEDNGFKLLVTPVLSGNPENKINYAFENEKQSEMMLFNEYTVSISYLFDDQLSTDKEWLDEWSIQEKQSLPIAVRLRFEAHKDNPELKSFNLVSPVAAHKNQLIRSIIR